MELEDIEDRERLSKKVLLKVIGFIEKMDIKNGSIQMVLESRKNFKQLRIKIWQLLDLFYFRNYICGTILKSSILLWLKGKNTEKIELIGKK